MPTRRHFLHQSSRLAAAGLILPATLASCGGDTAPASAPENEERDAPEMASGDLESFGIQLYTLREAMPKDPRGTLRKIADMGYTQIEGYEGDMGIFWGMEAQEYKDYLDELGLTMVATHVNIMDNFERKSRDAASIGVDYLVCPSISGMLNNQGMTYPQIVEKFNECGQICADNGLRFAYHNHAYSFEDEVEGMVAQDYMMQNTSDNVDYEMDIYWVVTAGVDPVEWLEKYPNKWTLCHVKDRDSNAGPEDHHASVNLGEGSIDFSRILPVAKANGMEYYILEQERYEGSTPLKSAEAGARFMEQFKFS